MLKLKDYERIRPEITRAFDVAIRSKDPHAKEKVILDYSKRHGLTFTPLDDRNIIMWQPGGDYALVCEVHTYRMVVKTIGLSEEMKTLLRRVR